jgi:hypothetical protein
MNTCFDAHVYVSNSHYAVPLKQGVVLPLPLSPSPKKGGETVHKRCASNERKRLRNTAH